MAVALEHAELNEQINAYLDGELDASSRAAFEQHLQACAACQVEFEQLRGTRGALQSLSLLRAPRPMTVTAPARSGVTTAGEGRLARLLPWTWRLGSFATCACLAMALLSVYLGGGLGSRPGQATGALTSAQSASVPAGGAQSAADRSVPPEAAQRSALQEGQANASPPAPQRAAQAPQAALAPPGTQPAQDASRSRFSPGEGAGTANGGGVPAGAAATPPQGASASTPAAQQPADLAKSAPQDGAVANGAARDAASGQSAAARREALPPRGGAAPYWLSAAALLALTSGAAFAVERGWMRRA